ncbi:trk system potassium uptake protein TrkH [Deinobacterium chartae]|uniref:Trk system potassium uptake protein TrkH n=1 Tax=Deinobacterium chartae TaxID=521158 RepID=A0A841I1L5_9DEIO|nr:TrkH family potassium uptake protein [Deinobacterium chartae]MBB6097962.1 trk system potassium uptake protein TrkH [Deinobacterium chartae]
MLRHLRLPRFTPPQLIALTFALGIVIGGLLLALPFAHAPGKHVSLLTAFFTATSALCVTGLNVVDPGTTWSLAGQIIILLLIQVGGLGIVTFGTLFAFLSGRRIGFGERLRLAQQLNALEVGGVVDLLRRIVLYTAVIEGIGALLLYPRFAALEGPLRGAYFAVFHAVSAFNNAGFALYPDNLMRFVSDPLITGVISALVISGGLGFLTFIGLQLYRRDPRAFRLSLNTRIALATTAFLLLAGTLTVAAFEWNNPKTLGPLPLGGKLLGSVFQAVVPRTAGFNSVDYGGLTQATLFITTLLMFVGANPGSTGGGIKTTTFFVLVTSAWSMVRGRGEMVAFRRRIDSELVVRAGVVTVLSLTLVVTALLVLTLTDAKLPFLNLAFEAFSAFATVGLSINTTPLISPAGQIVLILLMYLGRIGPLTFAIALARPSRRGVGYPADRNVLIG